MVKNKQYRSTVPLYPENKPKPNSLIKKTAIITCLGLTLTFGVVNAENEELTTVYHVYVDGKYTGTVDQKNVVEQLVERTIKESQDKLKDYSLAVGENISYVPEKTFDPSYNNSRAVDTLEDQLSVVVNAYALTVGDKVVGYFKDKETAEKVIRNYKAKFVDPEILTKLEKDKQNQKNQENQVPTNEQQLSVGDSIIKDVTLSEDITFSKDKALPKDILTEKEGMKLLEKGTLEDEIHKVKEGDVLGGIAAKYNLDIETILKLNPDLTEESLLQIGQEINVTDYKPFLDVFVKQEELVEEEISYETEVVSSDDMFKGETKVRQEGQEGSKLVQYAIEKKNGQIVSKEIIEEKTTKEPVKKIVVKGTKVAPSRGSGQFTSPTYGGIITSPYGSRWGSFHKGLDISGVSNRTIKAIDNGVVVSAGWNSGGYGYMVIVDHGNGYRSLYAHMASVSVKPGQTITRGSQVGVMGSTGNSTGVHLHIEVTKNGATVNPSNLF
ncbi:M23 family metallopeptidase [Aquibacillus sp. 3ASR75-11]|uniref:M23 family metallopeptidase n=1 Tax=Terrihalobacillus insolitus TaxID=2950438 RepID=A0A9X3WXG7_9BACI|nr:M23 family metallopeptidase [Terrihalobacillus insolitus]MDC3415056.1 M23 family metallopeptidase [Terrihalobacillus insolitus]MDC3425976.1 M23 family metallopeptidase [Terrihalobacillus insolitus]